MFDSDVRLHIQVPYPSIHNPGTKEQVKILVRDYLAPLGKQFAEKAQETRQTRLPTVQYD